MFTGSPPPMRGKVNPRYLFPLWAGITPAYAGKRHNHDPHFRRYQDHPRLCGEKVRQGFSVISTLGSPPPMRGKVKNAFCRIRSIRITPAYAGKRCQVRRDHRLEQDHPRLCGEKRIVKLQADGYTGSPPPMRGKVQKNLIGSLRNGITPAYAGKSFLQRCRSPL